MWRRAEQRRAAQHPHPDPDPAQARLPYPWPGAPTLPLPRRAYPTPGQARLHETLRQAVERHAAQILAAVDDHEA